VRNLLGHLAVLIIIFFLLRVGRGPAVLDYSVFVPVLECQRVCHSWFSLLVDCIEHPEDLSAYQLVVSVHQKSYLVVFAVLSNSYVDVGHGCHLLTIDYDLYSLLVNAHLFEHVLYEDASVVGGGVVYDDYMVVAVVLKEYAV